VTLTVADMPGSVREDGLVASARGPRADRPKRRTFTPAYKLAIVEQYDQLADGRERGAPPAPAGSGSHPSHRGCPPESGSTSPPPPSKRRWHHTRTKPPDVSSGLTGSELAPAQAPTRPPQINLAEHRIRRKQVLGGLTHEYQIAA
jgi:hypothetical protein